MIAPFGNAIISGFVGRSRWLYWDTVNVLGASVLSELRPFRVPMNQQDPVTGKYKTKHETNMVACASFGVLRAMHVERIGIYFPLWLSDQLIDQMMSRGYVEFLIGEKIFWEGRLDICEELQTGEPVRENKKEGEVFNPAEFSVRTVQMRMRESKYIPPLVCFTFAIYFDPSVVLDFEGIRPIMVPIIDGQCDRPVQ
jgi:hypothetical protein